jgi:hypothetical protein
MLAEQALYHMGHNSSHFAFSWFSDRVLCFCPGWSQMSILSFTFPSSWDNRPVPYLAFAGVLQDYFLASSYYLQTSQKYSLRSYIHLLNCHVPVGSFPHLFGISVSITWAGSTWLLALDFLFLKLPPLIFSGNSYLPREHDDQIHGC